VSQDERIDDVPLILLSGMAADERLFEPQRLSFPHPRVPAWVEPLPGAGAPGLPAFYASPCLQILSPAGIFGRMSEVTRILSTIEQGDPSAAEQLLPLVYDELRKLAAAKLAQEKPGQTLQATALVHEAYLRLVDVAQARRRLESRTSGFMSW
jgi:hypothetical protein